MPATGRREEDEGYLALSVEELAAVYRVARALERTLMGSAIAIWERPVLMQDADRVRYALTRIKFITQEDQA